MLKQIHIKNFAIIDNLDLELKTGMSVITGETGAGKSIVIDALDIALGERADSSMIREGASRCEINLLFDVNHIKNAITWLKDRELDDDDSTEVSIRRVFSKEGRSKNYINGTIVTLAQLKDLSRRLLHTHGQHEHQALFRKEAQGQLLDKFAKLESKAESVNQYYQQWAEINKQIENLCNNQTDNTAKVDLLQYQVNELQTLNLQDNEVENLHQEHKRLANAEELILKLHQCCENLTNHPEFAIIDKINQTIQHIQSISEHFKDSQMVIDCLQHALIQLEEAYTQISHWQAETECDPEKLNQASNRLDEIYSMARKHRVDANDLPSIFEKLKTELDSLLNKDHYLQDLLSKQKHIFEQFETAALKLSQERVKAAKKLSKSTTASMQQLGMAGGLFKIDCKTKSQPSASGLDDIEFMVSMNQGQSYKPLSKVASGGELSRISLAIQVITAQLDATPTLIFDEVDVGIGGGVAQIVGQLLAKLGESAQVICITHLPQVASQGDQHYKIAKQNTQDGTLSQIVCLNKKEREQEIARMLGGVEITKQTLAHAKEMLALS